jgi:hypothetical protein
MNWKKLLWGTLLSGAVILVGWGILWLLLPWLSYARILAGVAVLFLSAGMITFGAAIRVSLLKQEEPSGVRRRMLRAAFYCAAGIGWLAVGRFFLKLW